LRIVSCIFEGIQIKKMIMKITQISLFILLFQTQLVVAQQGLKGEYFASEDLLTKVLTRTDAKIDFDWKIGTSPAEGISSEKYGIRWTGRLRAPKTGVYTFSAKVDDGIRVWVGGIQVINAWQWNDSKDFTGQVSMEAGTFYDLKVEYFNGTREGEVHLFWNLPNQEKPIWSPFGSKPIPQVIESQYFYAPEPVKSTPPKPPVPPSKPTVVAKPKPKSKTIDLDTVTHYVAQNVLFEKSTSVMYPASFEELDKLATMLKKFPKKQIMVEGHTDYIGNAQSNLRLSQERAQVVAQYLIDKGIDNQRVTFVGYGGARPVSQEDTPEGHARNRRVAFVIQH
jgi:outer membrane protein OmpA-like peptidoglycan-associated protein